MVDNRQISKSIPVELKTISNWAFAARVAIWASILVAGGILTAGSAPLTIALGIVILGVGSHIENFTCSVENYDLSKKISFDLQKEHTHA